MEVSSSPESAQFALDVARFQQDNGLAVDGIAGPKSHAAAKGGQLEPGVLGADDELEDGVLGADDDQLEDGLIGMDDPMFTGGAARGGDANRLESGVLGVQGKDLPAGDTASVHAAAARGVQGAAQDLPHRERIEASFGTDLSNVKAHVGGEAAEASAAMGAKAYATGDQVAFAQQPDLHTAAHEAAHVVQQKAGVQLMGGVGEVGDRYEQQADAAADKVVRGESVTELSTLARSPSAAVQRKASQQTQLPLMAENLMFISEAVDRNLSKVHDSLKGDSRSAHVQILVGLNAELRQPLLDTTHRMAECALPELIALAPQVHNASESLKRFFGWAAFDTGGAIEAPFARTLVLTNQVRAAVGLSAIAPSRPALNPTEAANVDGLCQAIAWKYHDVCIRQRDAVKDLHDESLKQDPPSLQERVLFAAMQVASGFALGAIGSAVSAGAKAYLAANQPELHSIDAGFIADLIKVGTTVFIKTASGEAFKSYQDSRDPKQMFFQSQRDALTQTAEHMRDEFLVVGRQELLRTKDPVGNAQALLESLNQQKEAAYVAQRNATLDQWCVAMAKGQMGTDNDFGDKEEEQGADFGNKPGHANPLTTNQDRLKGAGTLDICIHVDSPGDTPEIRWAYIGGLNRQLREWLGARPVSQLNVPIVVRGTAGLDANHPGAPKIWAARNTAGTVWVKEGSGHYTIKKGMEWLNARGGGAGSGRTGALAGARKLIEEDMAGLSVAGKFRT